jgi:LCP family protein required for cell wall assembly
MPNNHLTPNRFKRTAQLPNKPMPGQDIIVAKKQAKQFPGIGTTLSSYSTAAKDIPSITKPTKDRFYKRLFTKRRIKRFGLIFVGLVILAGLVLGGKFLYELKKSFGGSIFDLLHTSKLKGEDQGRVTILLAGDSADDPGHAGGDLTDSIMLVSINTKNNTAIMLSIPRDLWVKPPGGSYEKINAVYENGQQSGFSASGYPNGGMGALEQVVSQKFDIPIDYYSLIDYTAFKQAVDAVGGITVNIQSSNPKGLYDAYTNLKLPNGEVQLNGQEALNLARARGDNSAGDISYGFSDGDFDRTMHQREMLVALTAKATSGGVLSNPVKLSNLFSALGDNVKTDFNLSDARRLYQLSKLIPQNKITSLSLQNDNGKDLLQNYDGDGQSAFIPALGINNYSDIDNFLAKYTSNNPVVQEDATVTILNGTNIFGLASDYKTKLVSEHFNVTNTGDAYTSDIATTQIIDNSQGKMPNTRAALVSDFGNNVTTQNSYSAIYNTNFIVVLGNNQSATTQ